jgi:hypothetical protein
MRSETMLPGIRDLREGQSRLFEPMHKVTLILDSFGIGIMYALLGRVEIEESVRNSTAAQCAQFPITVRIPVVKTLRAVAQGKPLTEIRFAFLEKKPAPPLPPGKVQTTVKGHGAITLSAITPIYVDFFEKHRLWIKASFGSDAYKWSPLFNFARALRNFISHHAGHVHFDNPNAMPVNWHHLQYSPADEGKKVIAADIDIGDFIVFMFEFADELDRHGCPLNP